VELERKSGKFLPSCVNTVNEALDKPPTMAVSGALFSRHQTKKNRRAASCQAARQADGSRSLTIFKSLDPGLRRDDVFSEVDLNVVIPAQAGTQRLLLRLGMFGFN